MAGLKTRPTFGDSCREFVMRTSGGPGLEGWIMAIPIVALIVAMTMNRGGAHDAVVAAERMIRETLASAMGFLARVL